MPNAIIFKKRAHNISMSISCVYSIDLLLITAPSSSISLLLQDRYHHKLRLIRLIPPFADQSVFYSCSYYYNETLPSVAEGRSCKIVGLRLNTAIQGNFYTSVIFVERRIDRALVVVLYGIHHN
jgi:hypothetical protein